MKLMIHHLKKNIKFKIQTSEVACEKKKQFCEKKLYLEILQNSQKNTCELKRVSCPGDSLWILENWYVALSSYITVNPLAPKQTSFHRVFSNKKGNSSETVHDASLCW